MTPRSKKTKLKKLNWQFKKAKGNIELENNILKKIQTLENTAGR